jgi:predicted phosphoribosyltransferase
VTAITVAPDPALEPGLTASDSKELARTEHQRNYAACRNGYCDLSQLTAAEVRSLLAEHAPPR